MGVKEFDLVLASSNPHKITEIGRILGADFNLRTLSEMGIYDELPETSLTITGNASQKALAVWDLTGVNCLADDSGLEVEALGGKPGVDSAFFAGFPRNDERNIVFLLEQLEGVVNRSASFVTVLALVLDGQLHLFEGRVYGKISQSRRGSSGFGYDSVFIPRDYNITFAQMSPDQKNSISHRFIALEKLNCFLNGL